MSDVVLAAIISTLGVVLVAFLGRINSHAAATETHAREASEQATEAAVQATDAAAYGKPTGNGFAAYVRESLEQLLEDNTDMRLEIGQLWNRDHIDHMQHRKTIQRLDALEQKETKR